jgi:16S rRNA G966 N2-methylase RsmD
MLSDTLIGIGDSADSGIRMNKLYYGDNLAVLRQQDGTGHLVIGTETVDLVYLDPPFNSHATYTRHKSLSPCSNGLFYAPRKREM